MERSPKPVKPRSVGSVVVRSLSNLINIGLEQEVSQGDDALRGLNVNDRVRIKKKPYNYAENKGNFVGLSDASYKIEEFKFAKTGQALFKLSDQQKWFFRQELVKAGPESAVAEVQIQRASLRQDLNKHLASAMKSQTGPSFEERMKEAVRRFGIKSKTIEKEQRKCLAEAVERGRSRPPCAVVRPIAENPDPKAMLRDRRMKMQEDEKAYQHQLAVIKFRAEDREPIFKPSEIQAAFDILRLQQEMRKQEIQQREREGWHQICAIEKAAFSRPLLIEDYNYKPPRHSGSAPDLKVSEGDVAARPQSAPNKLTQSKSRTRQSYKAPWS
eukprot:TRINITY_DN21055_c0_g1_i1.p1 TRINITY_DN21055_c0_g1~~TRINITY_DN21055_c0_g1_i1.p1  ORF type:complete len:328 (-),score=55.64 TRINITY_DN21055_c0_g1_i1:511-1494(-)